MPRTLIGWSIGFFSGFAWFVGASFFEGHGGQPLQENVAGCIALILYIVLGQVLLPRDPTADTAEDWCVRASMTAPLVMFALWVLTAGGQIRGDQFLPVVSMLAAGCTGVLLGGVLARSLTRSAQAEAARAAARSKMLGNTGAALYVGVSVILFAIVVPAIVSNNDLPRFRSASRTVMVFAVLHAVFAAAVLWRTRKGKAPIAPAVFGFLMIMVLALGGAAHSASGPAMRAASIAHFLCAALDMVACTCCVGVVIQRQDVPPFLVEK